MMNREPVVLDGVKKIVIEFSEPISFHDLALLHDVVGKLTDEKASFVMTINPSETVEAVQ